MTVLPDAIWMFAASLVLHVGLARVLTRVNRLLLFVACGATVGGSWIACQLLLAGAPVDITFLRDVLLFACICEFYIILMMFSLASVSASIVHRMHREPMTEAQMEAEYSSQEMVRSRLERLVNTGYVIETDGQLVLADKAHRSVRIFDFVRAFFGHGR